MNNLQQRFLELRKKYIEKCFSGLNSVQSQAVFKVDGPLLILAGAGSGKTTVLVNRIANLVRFGRAYDSDVIFGDVTESEIKEVEEAIEDGELSPRVEKMMCVDAIRPWNVLAITFTNKAAGELKVRLEEILGEAGRDVAASTFHSACVRILRKESSKIGYPEGFTIYDSDDSTRAMKNIFKQLEVDDKFIPVKAALSAVSHYKDKMISPDDAIELAADIRQKLTAKIYKAYAVKLKSAGALDFDDLIYCTVRLFEKESEVLDYYHNKFKYILVDEYQDTSIAQFRLISLLGGGANNVCVVGDDDQSIYRFRGATIENILSFEDCFKNAEVVRLEQNYRSTSNILNAANCVIKNNLGRKGKTLWTESGEGKKLHHYRADNEHDEASHIATIIGENLKKGASLKDHAILYRANAQSSPVENYFARAGIPYKIVGGRRFFDRKEVKDILSYLSIIVNKQDDLRLSRIINEPSRKIGISTVEKLAATAAREGLPILEIVENISQYPEFLRATSPVQRFWSLYTVLQTAYETKTLSELVQVIIDESGYRAMLEALGEEGETRLENLGQLVSGVKTYEIEKGEAATLQGYLEDVALISDMDSYSADSDVVVMMTMHASKGLEFPYVFIIGMEDGIFPGEMSRYNPEDIEEERRLCYVGITRAKKELYFTSAEVRIVFGQSKRNKPSSFLGEIDEALIENETSFAISRRKPLSAVKGPSEASKSMSNFINATRLSANFETPKQDKTKTKPKFKTGDIISHKVFGKGEVIQVTPLADDMIVEIRFEKVGVKKTMANYAPLSLVE